MPLGSLLEQLVHLVQRRAGADAGRGPGPGFRWRAGRCSGSAWPGPIVQFAVAKEEKGAMVPVALRTYQRSRSSGVMRIGRVALHIDPLDPAAVDEVVDEAAAPGGADRVALMSAIETPSALALAWSMSMCSCGVSSRLLGRTPEQRIARRQAQQLVAGLHQAGMAEIAAVFQLEVEAGGIAQFLHRRRHQGEDLRVADA